MTSATGLREWTDGPDTAPAKTPHPLPSRCHDFRCAQAPHPWDRLYMAGVRPPARHRHHRPAPSRQDRASCAAWAATLTPATSTTRPSTGALGGPGPGRVDLPTAGPRHYASGGWSVGAVALVANWLARTEPEHTRIAAVFPDGVHRHWNTVYSDEYCRAHDLLRCCPAADPDEIAYPGEWSVERWTRCTHITPPRRRAMKSRCGTRTGAQGRSALLIKDLRPSPQDAQPLPIDEPQDQPGNRPPLPGGDIRDEATEATS